jgi:hypothetical protein
MKRFSSRFRRVSAIWGALALAVLSSGCLETARMSSAEQADKDREQRLQTLEEGNAAIQAKLRILTEQEERRAARVTELLERAGARLDALTNDRAEQGRQLESLRDQIRGIRGTPAGPRTEAAPECRWLGRRAILVLLRDDMIAAEGFIRLYNNMGCPMDHLGQAFGCSVPVAQPTAGPAVEAQVDSCWRDLKPVRPQTQP